MSEELSIRLPVAMTLEEQENLKKEDEYALNQCRWNGFIGVCQKTPRIYMAVIRSPAGSNHPRGWLGVYRTPEEAATVYDREAYRLYGSKALLNFPDLVIGTEPQMFDLEAYRREYKIYDYTQLDNSSTTSSSSSSEHTTTFQVTTASEGTTIASSDDQVTTTGASEGNRIASSL